MLKVFGAHVRGNLVAYVALFLALGGTTYAATGGNFILGKPNTAGNPTSLSAPVAGSALQLTNKSTAAGAKGLALNVAAGHAPFSVNSGAKVANLNADKLDGLDSTAFLPSSKVKTLRLAPPDGCVSNGDPGCTATFSLGGLSLAASCGLTAGGAPAQLELDNASGTGIVDIERVTGSTAEQDTVGANQPLFTLTSVSQLGTTTQGSLIDRSALKPESANFVGSVAMSTNSHGVAAASCFLALVGVGPR